METLLSPEEEMNIQEFAKITHSSNYGAKYMFVSREDQNKHYPVLIYANMHEQPKTDNTKPLETRKDCVLYCDEMNRKLGHNKLSMFMLLESIRLEEQLRKKLRITNELKLTSDFTIRESAGYKFILLDKGNGIIESTSIIEALNQGLAAMKREKEMKAIQERNQGVSHKNTLRNYKW